VTGPLVFCPKFRIGQKGCICATIVAWGQQFLKI
jgi:hypothetical protein